MGPDKRRPLSGMTLLGIGAPRLYALSNRSRAALS